jgi:hypothetical protein
VTDGRPLFFIHVMKTGGWTFATQMYDNLPGAVFPDPDLDPQASTDVLVDRLRRIPDERRQELRAYVGHFPYVATDVVPDDVYRITILRNPVDRTLSRLRHAAERNPQFADLTLEQIYDNVFQFRWFLHNHQAKIFSLTTGDAPPDKLSYQTYIDVDAERLERAKANLANVDLLGLTERFDEVLEEAGRRFGWTVDLDQRLTRTTDDGDPPPDHFVERIRQDNAADLEFYDYAVDLYNQRSAPLRHL